MKYLTVVALVSWVLIDMCASPGWAQGYRYRAIPARQPSGPFYPQRPPAYAPAAAVARTAGPYYQPSAMMPPAPQPRTWLWADAQGRRWTTVERFHPVWDPARQSWVYQGVHEAPAAASATKQRGVDQGFAAQGLGTNQLGSSGPGATGQPGSANQPQQPGAGGAPPAALGTNGLGPPGTSAPTAPAMALGANAIGQPADPHVVSASVVASNPGQSLTQSFRSQVGQQSPQPLFAPNLGIYYEKVPYTNGTFGARLTSDPIPNSPASQLPLDVGDVIYMLDGKRMTATEDILRYGNPTHVDYIDATDRSQKSGDVNIPQPKDQ
jgi:hypothetical protein